MSSRRATSSIPPSAWEADREARARGRVQMLNAGRPGGLDGWTIRLEQWELLRSHILDTIDALADEDGSVPLQAVVETAQARLASHPMFPGGRMTNYVRFVKVDLEARGEVERVPRSSPQRVRRSA
jgi:hypothetical protein